MKKKRVFSILAMVFALVIVFTITGCNDDDGNKKKNVDQQTENEDGDRLPPVSEIKRCTLCDTGEKLFETNTWLQEEYEGEIIYLILRTEKVSYPRKIYIAGVTEDSLVIHNQRTVETQDFSPENLVNLFGPGFYEFGSGQEIDSRNSAEILHVGLMKEIPLLEELVDPAELGANEKCGLPYSIGEKNWEYGLAAGMPFYRFDNEKLKFNQINCEKTQVTTFDCQRDLNPDKALETQSLLPLGPRVETTDGSIAGEVINSNPPRMGAGGSLPDLTITPLSCQNDSYTVDPDNEFAYNFQDPLEIGKLFMEVNNLGDGSYKLKLNLKVSSDKVVTVKCWELIAEGYDVAGGDLDLNNLDLDFDFSEQYHPQNGGCYDTVWVGIADSCYSSYEVGTENWQFYIEAGTVFAEINKLHTDGLHKIKFNIRYGNVVYTFTCLRDAEEHRAWSEEVLDEHISDLGYEFTFQGVPQDAYRSEDTVWVAVSSDKKPSCMK